jgi:hypothetical protein
LRPPCWSTPKENRAYFFYFLPLLALYSVSYLVFHPGIMTTDTLIQLGQIRSGQYNDWHPLLHTYYLRLLSAQPFGIPLAAWIQACLFAAALAASLTALEGPRPSPIARSVALLLLLLQPLHAVYAVTLWKDISFSLAVVALVQMA